MTRRAAFVHCGFRGQLPHASVVYSFFFWVWEVLYRLSVAPAVACGIVGKLVTAEVLLPVWIDGLGTRHDGGDVLLFAKCAMLAVRIARVGHHGYLIGAHRHLCIAIGWSCCWSLPSLVSSKATISLCSASTAI